MPRSARSPGLTCNTSCHVQTGEPVCRWQSSLIRYFSSDVSHWLAMTVYHISQSRPRASRNRIGLISGNAGVSAIRNGALQVVAPALRRAPMIRTSSAQRSPEPWNHAASRSPLTSSTIVDPCTCSLTGGKISIAWYASSAPTTAALHAIRIMHARYGPPPERILCRIVAVLSTGVPNAEIIPAAQADATFAGEMRDVLRTAACDHQCGGVPPAGQLNTKVLPGG